MFGETNCETGETIIRELTTEEIAQAEADRAQAALLAQKEAETIAKKAAILAALANATGYTADELREALNA